MTREEFEHLTEETLTELPIYFRQKMDNVVVYIEDYPTGEMFKKYGRRNLLGVFIGVPITNQTWEGGYLPHRIILYQKNIEDYSDNETSVKEQIRETVIHEIGHYFGLSEEDLRRLQGL